MIGLVYDSSVVLTNLRVVSSSCINFYFCQDIIIHTSNKVNCNYSITKKIKLELIKAIDFIILISQTFF